MSERANDNTKIAIPENEGDINRSSYGLNESTREVLLGEGRISRDQRRVRGVCTDSAERTRRGYENGLRLCAEAISRSGDWACLEERLCDTGDSKDLSTRHIQDRALFEGVDTAQKTELIL